MRTSDADRFRNLLRGMGRTFGQDMDGLVLDVYWIALKDWTLAEFEKACAHLLKTARFMPRPADFNDLLNAAKPTDAEAWNAVLRHCRGAYRDGSGIDDGGPIDTAVGGLGGYRAIAFHDVDYLPILQRQFVERFNEQVDAIQTRAAIPQIASERRAEGLTHFGQLRPKLPAPAEGIAGSGGEVSRAHAQPVSRDQRAAEGTAAVLDCE